MRKINSLALGMCIALPVFFGCGADEISDTDINQLLQGSKGRWELYKKYTDTDGSKVERTYVLIFTKPDSYRWKELGKRDGEEETGLSYEEIGTYSIAESSPLMGTITFTPGEGEAWVASFEILGGSGDLLITKPDGQSLQYEWIRTTLGIAS